MDASSKYFETRKTTEALCLPLETEDYVVQPIPDVSPPKWHLAHTTWFFEQFILRDFIRGYKVFNENFHYLFNSYYETLGAHHPRFERGILTRPTCREVYRYRAYVDEKMGDLFGENSWTEEKKKKFETLIDLGIQHEQQHQELLLMDIQYIFWKNPLRPVYSRERRPSTNATDFTRSHFLNFNEGIYEIGAKSMGSFFYDNETPRHRVFLNPFSISSRLVTQSEFGEFIEEGGYTRPELWLSEGWYKVQQGGWSAPLYWEKIGRDWWQMSLLGPRPLKPSEPVAHISFYEASAFAAWKNARLPLESEWEIATRELPIEGNFLESETFSPLPAPASDTRTLLQAYGDAWEWTGSPYRPYPGYKAYEGQLSEYNGKFMCNQMVLRGGCYATPISHMRNSYRNFYAPESRWMIAGLRLARDL